MREIFTIAVILLSILLLGLVGQYVLDPQAMREAPLQAIYNTLQLFVLEGEWTALHDLPWQLEVTRFVAPLATISGVLVFLTQGAWNQVVNYFVRFRQEHVVVAGLGGLSWHFVESCARHYKLVVVENNPDNPLIERARRLNMSVIIGDILNPLVFDQVNLAGARHLVAFTGNDGLNVELAIKARAYMREKGASELLVHMHVENTQIAERLRNYPKFFSDSRAAQVKFFSVYDLNSRILLRDYPPEAFAHYFGRSQVHIALYNFGRQSEHILLEAIRVCHFANESRVRFSVFDESAATKGEKFLSTYPHLEALCEIEFIDMPLLEEKALDTIYAELLQSITQHVVCFPRDGDNLELALLLRSKLLNRRNSNAPIIVHMEQSSGLAQLLESNFGGPEIPDGLFPFGMLDEVLHHENVLADGLDVLARAFHETYLERRVGIDADPRLYSALHQWVGLSEPERSSNRQQADHLATKLRAVGCAMEEGPGTGFEFTDSEALLLARMEHNRWCAEKIASGWQYGPERVESAKLNPGIGTWENLAEAEQLAQIADVKRLPDLLARKVNRHILRDHRIGVTGHRRHRLDVNEPTLKVDIEAALAKIIKANPNRRFIVVSPLADGADREVAWIAMNKFGMALQVPLPLPFELYQTDFDSPQSVEEFKVMVGKSEVYFELPMRFGNQEELSSRIDHVANPNRNNQYALVGAHIVLNCDDLLAVYDGEGSAGVGGTGQIVDWRTKGSTEPEFRITSGFFPGPEITSPVIVEPVQSSVAQGESSG